MTVPLNITLEQLAETRSSLSDNEKEKLQSLLAQERERTKRSDQTINELLEQSESQHHRGEIRASEHVIRESKAKYGF